MLQNLTNRRNKILTLSSKFTTGNQNELLMHKNLQTDVVSFPFHEWMNDTCQEGYILVHSMFQALKPAWRVLNLIGPIEFTRYLSDKSWS